MFQFDPTAEFKRRIGKSAKELGQTDGRVDCPDIWELTDGNFAIIGKDVSSAMRGRLPAGVGIGADEHMVMISREMLMTAKSDIPDA